MRIGTEDKKKLGVLGVVGVLGVAAAAYIYSQLSTPDASPPAAPVVVTGPKAPAAKPAVRSVPAGNVVGGVAKNVGTTSAQLDPTLRMGPMLVTESLVYSGSGRNIFSMTSAPIAIPKPIAPARPKGPVVPVYTAPLGPPPPPPIDLKFFGTETLADGKRRAFLLKGEDVFLASDGDIVQRRYRIVTISANSVLVEDMANNNRQTLPLIGH
ncbi:MAG TPA: hypothetical protein VK578_08875 [Edaphobacter sp.]|nr:hypothetical protein [Edaphobacter sp.]